MTLQEFAALKIGDKIENPATSSSGEVVETSASGVRVIWGPRSPGNEMREHKLFYSAVTTAWMNWVKVS